MAATVRKTCRCGAVEVMLAVPARGAGTRVTCYCNDCQTAAGLFGHSDEFLSPGGGSEIWQTTPDRLTLTAGAEHLEILRLSPRGLYRWHARCCGTPMFNTMSRVHLPFVGVVLRQDELAGPAAGLGASRCRAFTKYAKPEPGAPVADRGFAGAGLQVLRRMAGAWIGGRATSNALLGDDGAPVAPVTVIPLEQRQAAVPAHLR
ncbi:DUF6151 family protein [Roseovarius sp. B08]|uniref:DUF6151 family protein n=1 Tax=Roseovarius sp. B08 TaxID=3449223 RepID=UPI003EDC26ED